MGQKMKYGSKFINVQKQNNYNISGLQLEKQIKFQQSIK